MADVQVLSVSTDIKNDEFVKVKTKSRKRKSDSMDVDSYKTDTKRPHLPAISASSLKVIEEMSFFNLQNYNI